MVVATQQIRRRKAAWWWYALSAAAIAIYAPLPYLTSSLDSLAAAGTGLAKHYAAEPHWVQVALYVHVVGGGTALLLSPWQFAARLRTRAPRAHRVVGRLALLGILAGGLAGLVIAFRDQAGLGGTIGFGALAVCWLASAGAAFAKIRRGDVEGHRRWMVRTFALTYAGVTLRLWLGIGIGVLVAAGVDDPFAKAYAVMPFLSWLPNILLAELWLRRRPAPARSLAK
ncbi:DUF2306 domain-containing protein [Hamadaea tsunoensis]|uniref:DUF2306 domain-containing protein n=1 Tax=Hamadaea tsunoensis TaxID=53368 RepID=UPI0003F714D7|nr:DUF2306 domain-containing protein [Hamadaea tsunoensis]